MKSTVKNKVQTSNNIKKKNWFVYYLNLSCHPYTPDVLLTSEPPVWHPDSSLTWACLSEALRCHGNLKLWCRCVQPSPSQAPAHCHAAWRQAGRGPVGAGETQVQHPPREEQPREHRQRQEEGERGRHPRVDKRQTPKCRQKSPTPTPFSHVTFSEI